MGEITATGLGNFFVSFSFCFFCSARCWSAAALVSGQSNFRARALVASNVAVSQRKQVTSIKRGSQYHWEESRQVPVHKLTHTHIYTHLFSSPPTPVSPPHIYEAR